MNTLSHVAASLWIGRDDEKWPAVTALVLGAWLPDLPMFGFYAFQKWCQRSEQEIWNHLYFEPQWQLFFDWFNSIPLAIVLLLVFYRVGFRWGMLFSARALLHMVCDLPVHHDDAHRHFLPLTNFRFESPVSYWDPAHFGIWFAAAELVFTMFTCAWIIRKSASRAMKYAAMAALGLIFAGLAMIACFVLYRYLF